MSQAQTTAGTEIIQANPAPQARPVFGMEGAEGQKPRRRGSNQGAVMLIVCAVSAAALVTMRQLGTKSGMNLTEAKGGVDLSAKEASQRADSYKRIMEDLKSVQRPLDVALENLGKSPFLLEVPKSAGELPASLEADAAAKAEEARVRAEQARKERLKSAFDALVLQSIIKGKTTLARISGETYEPGDTVGEVFTVKEIGEREVTLLADGDSFKLTMDSKPARRPGGNYPGMPPNVPPPRTTPPAPLPPQPGRR